MSKSMFPWVCSAINAIHQIAAVKLHVILKVWRLEVAERGVVAEHHGACSGDGMLRCEGTDAMRHHSRRYSHRIRPSQIQRSPWAEVVARGSGQTCKRWQFRVSGVIVLPRKQTSSHLSAVMT